MKKQLLALFTLSAISISVCSAQAIMYGMTTGGGTGGGGTIFQTDFTGAAFRNDYSFYNEASSPRSTLVQATNGLLYGLTNYGGAGNSGIIFSYDTSTSTYTDLYDFAGGAEGSSPNCSLIQATDGLLYGTTSYGGAYNAGVIFSYNITTGIETKLYDFGNVSTDAQAPYGSLYQATDGLLYGVTEGGGVNGSGAIYSYNTTTGIETKLYDFGNLNDGSYPYGSLIQASNGLLYGTTSEGGAYSTGIVFSYNTVTSTETDLHDFGNGTDGSYPQAAVLQVTDSLLYGTTEEGGVYYGGTLYSYNINSGVETDLYDFGNNADGSNPMCQLAQATNGLLYGTTFFGGINYYGTIFSYNISTATEATIHDFGIGTDGIYDAAAVLQASNGVLYGLTEGGGTANQGMLFSYNIGTLGYADLHNFGSGSTGKGPYGAVVQATNGLLYGLTSSGGNYGGGTLFSYDTNTGLVTALHHFGSSIDGSYPTGTLIQATDGLLYGTTEEGGPYYGGVLFSYDPVAASYTALHFFGGTNDADIPYGSLFQASNGLIYGMSEAGGTNDNGVIYTYNPTTKVETVVYNFGNIPYGQSPDGSLMQASNGLLYGTTDDEGGTYSEGTIFSFDPTSNTYTDLHSFGSGLDGTQPLADLVEANGALYGLTNSGGIYSAGIMFSYNITTTAYTDIHDFGGGTDGLAPYFNSLILGTDTALYGMVPYGGVYDSGMIFRYDLTTTAYSDIHDFTGNYGDYPFGNLYEVDTVSAINVSPSASICNGSSTVLTAIGGGSGTYTWQPSTGLNTTTGSSVIASPSVTTTYTVTTKTGSNTLSATDVVTVLSAPNKPSITISKTGDSLVSSAGSYNQWYFNGQPITDSTRQVLVIKGHSKGLFSVTVTNPANGCGTSSDSTTSINQLSLSDDQLSIYPNPTNSAVFVKINAAALNINNWSLELKDVLGRTLYTRSSLSYSNTIDLSNLPDGLYFIAVATTTGRTVFKVVKQN